MAQLLVRNLEPTLVKKLRSRAAAQGVSVEEAHRRLLRSALLGSEGRQQSFIDYLRSIPRSDGVEFPRSQDMPRDVEL